VLWKHVLRNSLITTFTVVGLQMAYLSGLITIVESVFNYPGIGYLLLNSIRTRDFVVVQAVVLFMVFVVIVVNLMVDILYFLTLEFVSDFGFGISSWLARFVV
jgi:glutathione transport system permease protein